MLAEFNTSNPLRCRLSELPYCACANKPETLHTFPPPPPTTYAEDYHSYPAYQEDEHVVGGGGEGVFDADQGQASALVKRMTNAHTIDLALRSSHRTLQCPGEDDGERSCARNCAAEHLTKLRAFTVTGAVIAPSAPPSEPHLAPPPSPGLPPYIPFTECQNTCLSIVEGDNKCRDGGKGSYLPSMCPYGTQCAQCGFRENTREIDSDNTCATANNGVCEDGGFGTQTFFVDPLYPEAGMTTNCALGTDGADCYDYGQRTSQEITSEAFQGLSNVTRPTPPPPGPAEPPSPPLPAAFFDGSRDTCRAIFYPDPAKPNAWIFDCSGTDEVIAHKRAGTGGFEKQCADNQQTDAVHKCSDGGYDSTSILWTNDYLSTDQASTHFACDYGTSMTDCNPRTQDVTTDIHCSRNGNDASGSCHDSCWVDTSGNVYHTNEEFDARTVANGGSIAVDQRCHDGGPNSVSNRCGFGTMSTRCGPGRTVAYTAPLKYTQGRRLSALDRDRLPAAAAAAGRQRRRPVPAADPALAPALAVALAALAAAPLRRPLHHRRASTLRAACARASPRTRTRARQRACLAGATSRFAHAPPPSSRRRSCTRRTPY